MAATHRSDRTSLLRPRRRKTDDVAAAQPTTVATASDANERLVESLNRSQARINLTPDGEILDANANFLGALGYTLDEVRGKHHSIFVDPTEAKSQTYLDFWAKLRRGEFQTAEYLRIGKGGRRVWIQATYNPVMDDAGQVTSVVKFATDITQQREAEQEIRNRSQAVIEFLPDGTILDANHRFLQCTGYSLSEIKGQHHRMFMPHDEATSASYAEHWPALARGEFRQGEFHRVDKHGNDLYLQGAYNPVFDADGKVNRVIKGANDITQQVQAKATADRIGQQIASNLGEMDAALGEISSSVAGTATLAQSAESDAENATNVVHQLNQSSESIGKVVTTIQRLSEQTNLLALNATIEAARAGESGRGFAVVANEVKVLSNQTGDATEDIRSSIEAIQADISTVVHAIQDIVEGVAEVSSNTHTVAAAIEEQAVLMTQMNETARDLLSVNRSN